MGDGAHGGDVLRRIAYALGNGAGRGANGNLLPQKRYRTSCFLPYAGNQFQYFGFPRAGDARDSQYFPPGDGKTYVLHGIPSQMLHREEDAAGGRGPAVYLRGLPAGHGGDEELSGAGLPFKTACGNAVSQEEDAAGNVQRIVDGMGDVDHGDVPFVQIADSVPEHGLIHIGIKKGRLVDDQNGWMRSIDSGQLHQCLLRGAQAPGQLRGRDVIHTDIPQIFFSQRVLPPFP